MDPEELAEIVRQTVEAMAQEPGGGGSPSSLFNFFENLSAGVRELFGEFTGGRMDEATRRVVESPFAQDTLFPLIGGQPNIRTNHLPGLVGADGIALPLFNSIIIDHNAHLFNNDDEMSMERLLTHEAGHIFELRGVDREFVRSVGNKFNRYRALNPERYGSKSVVEHFAEVWTEGLNFVREFGSMQMTPDRFMELAMHRDKVSPGVLDVVKWLMDQDMFDPPSPFLRERHLETSPGQDALRRLMENTVPIRPDATSRWDPLDPEPTPGAENRPNIIQSSNRDVLQGIFEEQGVLPGQAASNPERARRFFEAITPVGYGIGNVSDGDVPTQLRGRRISDALWGKEQKEPRPKAPDQREDAWRMYLGIPQEHNTFEIAKHKPTKASDPDALYYSISNLEDRPWASTDIKFLKERWDAPWFQGKEPLLLEDLIFGDGLHLPATDVGVMGAFTIDFGEDEHGPYMSYYDKWNLGGHPIEGEEGRLGKPFEIYGRIYYDPDTMRPLPEQP